MISADRQKLLTSTRQNTDQESRRRDGRNANQSVSTQVNNPTAARIGQFWSYYLGTIEQDIRYLAKTSGVAEVKGLNDRANRGDTLAMAALGLIYLGDLSTTIRKQYLPLGGPVPVREILFDPKLSIERKSDEVSQSLPKALAYFRRCTTKGNVICQTLLGEMYVSSSGVSGKVTAGRNLLKKSAEAGDVRAQQDLIWLQANDGAIDPMALMNVGKNTAEQILRQFKNITEPVKP